MPSNITATMTDTFLLHHEMTRLLSNIIASFMHLSLSYTDKALFSVLKQTRCAHVACDSALVTV